jgi:chromatin structure-remodeling complex protein RSC7
MPFKKGHRGFRRSYGGVRGSSFISALHILGADPRIAPSTPAMKEEDAANTQDESQVEQDVDAEGEPDEDDEAGGDDIDMGIDEEADALEEVDSNATPEVEDGQSPRPKARTARSKPPPDFDDTLPRGEVGYGTPRRVQRRRGGFKPKPRRGTAAAVAIAQTRQVVDKEGNTAIVEDDEVVLPEDPEGETKVSKLGVLSGGREYRVRVFKVLGRGERLYMLSTEPARCTGFRDSYLFFNRHLQLYKVLLDDEEKRDLIEREIIPHSYKGRAIGVVTARSVYREFGSKIIIRGKKIIDDYEVAEARARGDVEGELAEPEEAPPKEGNGYNKNQFVAWHGASKVYHNNAPSVPLQLGGRRKANVTMGNWMFEHSRAAMGFNSRLAAMRRETLAGVYDPHTNVMCYPRIMQPTHARWEYVPPEPVASASRKRKLDMLNGSTWIPAPPSSDPSAAAEAADDSTVPPVLTSPTTTAPSPTAPSILPPPSSLLTSNYLIIDTILTSAPHSNLPPPGPDNTDTTPLYPGSGQLPELDEDMAALLPPECREALFEAKVEEEAWRGQWGGEKRDGWRGDLRIGVGVLGI